MPGSNPLILFALTASGIVVGLWVMVVRELVREIVTRRRK